MNSLATLVPESLRPLVRKVLRRGPSRARREGNAWIRTHAAGIRGTVLSIGSGDDRDGEGGTYRSYFSSSDSYTTSEVTDEFPVDLVLDVRAMPEIPDSSYDCVFCSGVLEHVDDFQAALAELTRVLKPSGVLLLGLPFRQGLHLEPLDFWRFTKYGIKHLLDRDYEQIQINAIDTAVAGFPASYWTKAIKRAA